MGYELFIRLPRRDVEEKHDLQREPNAAPRDGDPVRPFQRLLAELPHVLDGTKDEISDKDAHGAPEGAAGQDQALPEIPEPGGRTTLEMGPARIAVHRPRIHEPGLDLSVPEGLTEQEAAQVLAGILETAGRCGLVVFDPQLGRLVGPHDADLVLLEWQNTNAYLLNTLGASPGAVAGGAWYPEYEEPRSPFATIWMVLGGLLLAALVLGRLCG